MIHSFSNHSLKYLNTFGIEAIARSLHVFENTSDLVNTAINLNHGLTLGGGSNMLFVNPYLDSVFKIDLKGVELIQEDENSVIIKVAAGEQWHELVLWTLSNQYGGLENLSLIPGTVGAAPIQNIGAYGVELKDLFVGLHLVDKTTRALKYLTHEDCQFGYRNSIFKNELKDQTIITSIELKLTKKSHKLNIDYGAIQEELLNLGVKGKCTISDISRAVINIRTRKLYDPAEVGNCGSFFKNPIISKANFEQLISSFPEAKYYANEEGRYKIPAGWLIESLGWKGRSVGEAAVSPKHALVLINKGNASGQEVYDLSSEIIESVNEKYGITLEREVNMIT